MSRPFRFKQFTIIQDHAAMKVGTDSVLLGSWVCFDNPKKILDIGCGTGLLALMMAQRFSNADIIAVEIDLEALIDAKTNIDNSDWGKRIQLFSGNILDFKFEEEFDIIITNPPYFPVDTKAPEHKRAIARSGKDFSFIKWLAYSKEKLSSTGIIAFILPIEEWLRIKPKINMLGLYIQRECHVSPNDFKKVNRILIELAGASNKQIYTKEELKIERDKRHTYSEEYIKLTRPFYLKMD